jgi:hypothetical protein
MITRETILFEEEQPFRQGWVWLMFTISSLVMVIGVGIVSYQESKQEMLIALSIVIPVQLLIAVMMYQTRLQIKVTTEAVFFRWWPLKKYKLLSRHEIEKAEVVEVSPLHSGYSFSFKHGQIHKVNNGKGIRFTLNNGKKIFLGTQRLTAFHEAVEELIRQQLK